MTRRKSPARNRLARSALLLTALAAPLSAQTGIDHQVLSNGGSSSTGGGLTLHGTVGQVLVGLTDDGSNDHRLGFWEVPKVLHTPTVTALSGATQAGARPTLDWSDVAGATSYEIEYDDNPGFSSPVIVNVAASTHTFTSDLSDDVYSWRVRALSPLASSIFSATDSYVIAVVVPPPPADLSIPSTSINFGSVDIGQTVTVAVAVSNVGGTSATSTPTLTGANSSRFSLSASSVTVSPGGVTTLNVTLTPTVAGSIVGTLTMNFGVETLTINLTGTGTVAATPAALSIGTPSLSFGNVAIGESKTLSIAATNSGGLTGTSTPTLAGGQSGLFSLSTSSLNVTGGSTGTLSITLTPTGVGAIAGTLTIDFGGGQLFTISMTGTAIEPLPLAEDLTVVADTLDFGEIVIGETSTLVLQVANAGVNTGLTVPTLDTDDAGFAVVADELAVAGGVTADRDITFTPAQEGAFIAIVSLDFGVATLQVVVKGLGVLPPPVIEVEQAFIDFGTHGRNMPSELSYWFTNTGASVLEIDTVEVDTSRWTVSIDPLTLAAGDSGLVAITYRSLVEGSFEDTIRITSNDPATPVLEIALAGQTIVGGQIGVATSFGVGAADVGVTVSNSLSITNDGEAALSVDLTFADGSPFSSTVATLTVEPGASGTIPIDLIPGAEGAITSLLTLATNDVFNPSVDVTLVGFGGVPPEGSVTIDFAVAPNDQGQRIVGNAVSGATIELQLNVTGAPEFSSWQARLVYDALAVQYVSDSFETHKLSANLVPQVTTGAGTVTVGGEFVDADGAGTSISGRTTLGNLLFEVQDGFTEESDVAVTLVTLDLTDGTQLALIMNSIGTLSDEVVAVSLNGDFDNSGNVDFLDLFLFADAFGGTDPIYDLDQNGLVNLEDFFLFADNFGARVQAKLLAKARELFGIPLFSELYQNFPNPFNSETTIRYQIREEAVVYLDIWDITGQKVRTLRQEMQQPGQYEVVWDGTDEGGRTVASGMYFTRFEAARFHTVNKMLFVK